MRKENRISTLACKFMNLFRSPSSSTEAVVAKEPEPVSLIQWVPTPLEIVRTMLELAQVGPEDVLCDLGCGDARILIMAVKEFGAKKAIGYEIRQDLYDGAMKEIRNQDLQNRVTLIKEDLLGADLSEASVITMYLSTTANEKVRPKLESEVQPSTRIVTHDFPIRMWQEEGTESCSTATLYLYRMPQAFQERSDTDAQ